MDRLEEMLRLQEVGDPIKCLVVDEDRAEQRLFRLDVMRGGAKSCGRFVDLLAKRRISWGH
jgi:hypothetical protein